MTHTTDTATAATRTAAILELADAWRAVDAADMAGDDAGDALIRETYRAEDAYVAAGVLTWEDVTTARKLAAGAAAAPAGMTPAARRSIAAHVAIARHIRPARVDVASSPAPAGNGATFGPWADHAPTCRCNVCA